MVLDNSLWKDQPVICLTLDVDWASEDALKASYDFIEQFGFKPTYFLTHRSTYLLNLIKNEKIQAGIHPNFLEGSSHGSNIHEVVDYFNNILPDAKYFRCHKYYDSNDITEELYKKGFLYDSNLCTFLDIVEPFVHRSGLIRFPIYFEDGAYLLHNRNLNFREVQNYLFNRNGLMIINLHPMHIVLNTPTYNYMRKIKDKLSRKTWNRLIDKELDHLAYNGRGLRTFINEVFKFIEKERIPVMTLEEIYHIITKNY